MLTFNELVENFPDKFATNGLKHLLAVPMFIRIYMRSAVPWDLIFSEILPPLPNMCFKIVVVAVQVIISKCCMV